MAGMLPGVECARRRRFHQSSDSPGTGGFHGGTRRSSFCLYTSNSEPNNASISSSWRHMTNQTHQDQRLGGAAREAKERLNERLKSHTKSDSKRNNRSKERSKRCGDGILGEIHKEVVGQNKQGSVWGKLIKWKTSSEKEECAVCLERFKAGQTLLHLPCAHRFHDTCLIPWLESNAHCPYCRMAILS